MPFDTVRLHQLLANLLVNAAQYGAKDSPVMIQACGESDSIVVKVTNYGPAIPANSLQAIFKPLVQLPMEGDEDTRPRTSLGLGLFIAREISVAHGGELEVKSDEVDGTIFTVRLPRSAAGGGPLNAQASTGVEADPKNLTPAVRVMPAAI